MLLIFLHPPTRLCDRCLLVILSVCGHDCCRSNLLISLKLGVFIGPINGKNWSTGGDLDTDCRSLFHFLRSCGIEDFRFIGISHTVTGHIFSKVDEMTDPDKLMDPHFGSDLADVWIRINLDSNLGLLLVEILALAEVSTLWAQSSLTIIGE